MKTNPTNNQEAVEAIGRILKDYGVHNYNVKADPKENINAFFGITVKDKDDTYINMSRINHVNPFITEEQYADYIMKQGMEMIMRLSNIMIVRN